MLLRRFCFTGFWNCGNCRQRQTNKLELYYIDTVQCETKNCTILGRTTLQNSYRFCFSRSTASISASFCCCARFKVSLSCSCSSRAAVCCRRDCTAAASLPSRRARSSHACYRTKPLTLTFSTHYIKKHTFIHIQISFKTKKFVLLTIFH
jgi:hypothetical protein